jgi:hypothetical protein
MHNSIIAYGGEQVLLHAFLSRHENDASYELHAMVTFQKDKYTLSKEAGWAPGKFFREKKNLFLVQESNLGISVQSIALPLSFTSGTLYRVEESLGTHGTGGSVGPTAYLKAMAK